LGHVGLEGRHYLHHFPHLPPLISLFCRISSPACKFALLGWRTCLCSGF
jgi:hypothetical protein